MSGKRNENIVPDYPPNNRVSAREAVRTINTASGKHTHTCTQTHTHSQPLVTAHHSGWEIKFPLPLTKYPHSIYSTAYVWVHNCMFVRLLGQRRFRAFGGLFIGVRPLLLFVSADGQLEVSSCTSWHFSPIQTTCMMKKWHFRTLWDMIDVTLQTFWLHRTQLIWGWQRKAKDQSETSSITLYKLSLRTVS